MTEALKYQNLNKSSSQVATVYIFYEGGSWMLSIPFDCNEISYEGFSAECVSFLESDIDDVDSFLQEGRIYWIQIDPQNKELIFPQTKIRLDSLEKNSSSLRVVCSFIDSSKEIIDAVNQIKLSST